MSVEDAKKLVTLIAENEEVGKKVHAAGTDVNAVIAIAAGNGITVAAEDLAALKDDAPVSDELSDEQLENVAGGFVTATAAALSVAAVSAGCAVAACAKA